ncbi:hypothetical protein B0H66DRAFT_467436 [Apodospora peruviana]|uniref:Uncharacterized protein n=1 Tax=Apodospora peruviana TaxID=516989 RepID=A0AAE0MFF5_9PEZI|nr:hypothetical protein B0H66DRAFT_467436 [Apodospora peruviana]
MLSSRPTFSIRRLIPQKKQAGFDEDDDPFYLHDEIDSIKAAYKDSKPRTWPLRTRKSSQPGFDIPRSEEIHRISLIPPFPGTPHSSRSSLCSCENHDGTSHDSPRSSPGLSQHRSPRSSPLLRPKHLEHLQHGRATSRSPTRIPGGEHPHSPPPTPQPSQHRATPEPEADLAEALSLTLEPEGGPAPTEGAINNRIGRQGSGRYSDNIQQLIRETEEAFKLRDSSIEAKLSPAALPERPERPERPEVDQCPAPMSNLPSPTRPTRVKSQRLSQPPIKSSTKPHVKALLLPNPARFTPVSKTKRTRSKKARRKSRAITSQPSRWALSESAKDLFTIRIFSRIEADEMLPESTLQEIRMSRGYQSQWAKYTESVVTGVESDEFTTRVETPNASPKLPQSMEQQVDTPRSSLSNPGEIDRDNGATPKPEMQHHEHDQQQGHVNAQNIDVEAQEDEDTLPIMMILEEQRNPIKTKTITYPAPPPKRGSPRRLPSRQLPPLPTIPEVIATGPENVVLSPTSVPGSAAKINKDDYVFFPSTPYTLTMPTFRHGPVRLAKADLPIGKLAAAVDDTLDWTAFQMAILGGAGDFFSEPTDYSRPSDAELGEQDDILTWYADFGLSGMGALVSADDELAAAAAAAKSHGRSNSTSSTTNKSNSSRGYPRTSRRRSSRASSSTKQQQSHHQRSKTADAPIPVSTETTPNANNNQQQKSQWDYQRRPFSSQQELGFQPLMAEAQPKRFLSGGRNHNNHVGLAIDATRRPSVDSIQSLPQSPMLDLVVSRDVEGNEYVVPMGFNLGHDLGDFLKWEAEHVFAAGYYGPDE